jgi:hypothetical protein
MKLRPEIQLPPPAEDDPVAIAVRAYARRVNPAKPRMRKRRIDPLKASNIVLVFDTETNLNAAQHLRFGTYQVYVDNRLDEAGLFFDHKTVSRHDQRTLQRYADRHDLKCQTLDNFIELVIYGIGYDLGAAIVGFNLPFDISRVARGHSTAKTPSMAGAYQAVITSSSQRSTTAWARYDPNIQSGQPLPPLW